MKRFWVGIMPDEGWGSSVELGVWAATGLMQYDVMFLHFATDSLIGCIEKVIRDSPARDPLHVTAVGATSLCKPQRWVYRDAVAVEITLRLVDPRY